MTRQRGATLAIILAVLALAMVAFVAAYALTRSMTSSEEAKVTEARLQLAADALEQFAAISTRLPCPADPAVDTGVEVWPGGATCSIAGGVLPWKTIGLRREDAFDGWGRKISYRVSTGNAGKGSLVQVGGASAVYCDTDEPAPAGTDPVTGLCRNPGAETLRTTHKDEFLGQPHLSLYDHGTTHSDVAYVVISHGRTGLGAYGATGVALEAPTGVERFNTMSTPATTYQLRPFSDTDTSTKSGNFFDDLVVYRRFPELVSRIKLTARNWDEPPPPPPPSPPPGSTVFNNPTIQSGGGNTSTSNTGTTQLTFSSGVTVSGFSNFNFTPTNISVDSPGGTTGIGIVNGSNPKMSYSEGEFLWITLPAGNTKFGITLNDFGTYTSGTRSYTERFALYFVDGNGNVLQTPVFNACRADGGLASFTHNVGVEYRSVLIVPLQATASQGPAGDSAFLLSEIRTCPATESTCRTSLWQGSNGCN